MKKIWLFVALSIGVCGSVTADGDAEAGKKIAGVCAACHGNDGNSSVAANPKIAGQHAGYLFKQLQEFKLASETSGEQGRNSMLMNSQVAYLSEQDMLDLAAYYSEQSLKLGGTPEDVVAQGEALYRGGDASRGITACIACHSADGKGMGLAGFPAIGGQHAEYTKAQLELFRSGERKNDLNGMMQDIAKKLSDEDIRILSQYLQGLH